jgi:hypothetical protein
MCEGAVWLPRGFIRDQMKLLPSKEDLVKLRFEFWKWVLLGALGLIVTLVIPPARMALWQFILTILESSQHSTSIPNPLLWALCLCVAFTVAVFVGEFLNRRRPAYQRLFMVGEYDNIVWRWSWDGSVVKSSSMTHFCTKCGTQLMLTRKADQLERRSSGDGFGYTESFRPDVEVFCTSCNNAWRITNCADVSTHVRLKIQGDANNNRWRQAYERVPPQFRRVDQHKSGLGS